MRDQGENWFDYGETKHGKRKMSALSLSEGSNIELDEGPNALGSISHNRVRTAATYGDAETEGKIRKGIGNVCEDFAIFDKVAAIGPEAKR